VPAGALGSLLVRQAHRSSPSGCGACHSEAPQVARSPICAGGFPSAQRSIRSKYPRWSRCLHWIPLPRAMPRHSSGSHILELKSPVLSCSSLAPQFGVQRQRIESRPSYPWVTTSSIDPAGGRPPINPDAGRRILRLESPDPRGSNPPLDVVLGPSASSGYLDIWMTYVSEMT
jgi:hypothetical protein